MTTIVTHNTKFHCNDVFAVAVMSLVFSDLKIIRTRDENIVKSADIVVDVGGIYDVGKMRFDDHQEGAAGVRENGIPYASFGLVWKEYGEKLSGSVEAAKLIEEKLVLSIDALDSGVSLAKPFFENINYYEICDYIDSFV